MGKVVSRGSREYWPEGGDDLSSPPSGPGAARLAALRGRRRHMQPSICLADGSFLADAIRREGVPRQDVYALARSGFSPDEALALVVAWKANGYRRGERPPRLADGSYLWATAQTLPSAECRQVYELLKFGVSPDDALARILARRGRS